MVSLLSLGKARARPYIPCSNFLLQMQCTALSLRPGLPLRLHQVPQDVVDAGEVGVALGAQPAQNPQIETDAGRVRTRTGIWADAAG